MVGTLTVVGSPVLDSAHSCPCLCLDSLPCSTVSQIKQGGGEMAVCRSSSASKRQLMSNRQITVCSSLELGSSFVDAGKLLHRAVNRSCLIRKHRSSRSSVIVSELAGQYEDSFDDVKGQILNYFTYKAVRTVLHQLYEMNPPKYTWFYNFVVSNNPADGKLFIKSLVKEHQELAERVMTTRLHLYGKWIKKCNHAEIYKEISEQNLELMRERLMETVIWPSDDSNTEKIG